MRQRNLSNRRIDLGGSTIFWHCTSWKAQVSHFKFFQQFIALCIGSLKKSWTAENMSQNVWHPQNFPFRLSSPTLGIRKIWLHTWFTQEVPHPPLMPVLLSLIWLSTTWFWLWRRRSQWTRRLRRPRRAELSIWQLIRHLANTSSVPHLVSHFLYSQS